MHPHSQGFMWWKTMPPDLFPSPVPAVNTILAEHGLTPIEKIGELLIGDKTFVLGLPETDPLPKTADVTHIGSVLWQRSDEKLPDWVSGLRRDRPVIWLYPGNMRYVRWADTVFDSAFVVQACIDALGGESVQVVLTTGHQSLPKRFARLPDNFRFAPFVPGLAMAEGSDMLIHHGGYGSCQTGLYTGKPALIIPTYSERESNARRIADQGAGDYLLPKSDEKGKKKYVSPEEIRAKVFHILSEPSFTENAKRISRGMKTYGGALEAAGLIERYI
jgi:UDP:flavonoid glycosyltransferase YjiC (YdhE family)